MAEKRDHVVGLADRLVAARTAAGLSQAAVFRMTGIARANIMHFEKGNKTPTLATLYKLASVYKIHVCDLLPEAVEDAPKPKRKRKST